MGVDGAAVGVLLDKAVDFIPGAKASASEGGEATSDDEHSCETAAKSAAGSVPVPSDRKHHPPPP